MNGMWFLNIIIIIIIIVVLEVINRSFLVGWLVKDALKELVMKRP
jgi:hypothetical protein